MPYLSARVRVTQRDDVTVSPIENAVDLLQTRTAALRREVGLHPPSVKALQAVLQGSVRLRKHTHIIYYTLFHLQYCFLYLYFFVFVFFSQGPPHRCFLHFCIFAFLVFFL